jgi:tRNA (guanine-N7-)-methyltransferase
MISGTLCVRMRTAGHIKSFVLRAGRMTSGQARALEQLWPEYGIDFANCALDLDAIFGRRAPRCLEIGFGIGEVIGALAQANPGVDYLGIEVHRPGVGRLLQHCAQAGISNLRIICHDAVEVLRYGIAAGALQEVLIFFPDPWRKKRHHKRRLIDAQFLELVADKLQTGGILRMATDWQPYAEQMLQHGNACGRFESLSCDGTFVDRYEARSPTRFERRGERLGHGVWDLAYRKK